MDELCVCMCVCVLVANAGWSDKDDLQSELNIMLNIEPHPNIINFLGMCSETGAWHGERPRETRPLRDMFL